MSNHIMNMNVEIRSSSKSVIEIIFDGQYSIIPHYCINFTIYPVPDYNRWY